MLIVTLLLSRLGCQRQGVLACLAVKLLFGCVNVRESKGVGEGIPVLVGVGPAEAEGVLEEDCGTVGLVSVGQLRGCARAILLYSIGSVTSNLPPPTKQNVKKERDKGKDDM